MPLSDAKIRTAKPAEKPYKLADERGLYLLVNPTGGRPGRLKYRVAGREKLLARGVYPDVSLKDARERRDEARAQIAKGIDPSAERKAAKTAGADTFEAVAQEWLSRSAATWIPTHAHRIARRLERDVFPWLGARPVGSIDAPRCLPRCDASRPVVSSRPHTASCKPVGKSSPMPLRPAVRARSDRRPARGPAARTRDAAFTRRSRSGGGRCALVREDRPARGRAEVGE